MTFKPIISSYTQYFRNLLQMSMKHITQSFDEPEEEDDEEDDEDGDRALRFLEVERWRVRRGEGDRLGEEEAEGERDLEREGEWRCLLLRPERSSLSARAFGDAPLRGDLLLPDLLLLLLLDLSTRSFSLVGLLAPA